MNAVECKVDAPSVQKLLSAGNGDAALLYLYTKRKRPPNSRTGIAADFCPVSVRCGNTAAIRTVAGGKNPLYPHR